MAEIAGTDLAAYTDDRLDGENDEVKRMLAAALVVARRQVGWHVSPVTPAPVTVNIDGPNSRILWLPTMKVVTLTSVEEDGVDLDLDTIATSVGDGQLLRRRTALRKRTGGWWSGEYGAIEIVMTHGFTELEAADWRQAIMSMVDQMSLLPVKEATGVSSFGQSSLKVDDVTLGYANPYTAMAEEVIFSVAHILCGYELAPVEFM